MKNEALLFKVLGKQNQAHMALRARSDGNKEQNMSDSRRCNAAPQSPAGAPSSSCSGSPSSSPSARGKGSAPPSPVSSEVVFQRPQAFKGTYRPSDRYERDHQHNAGAAGICHKKNIAPDLEWMYAHRKLDSEAHGKATARITEINKGNTD